MLTVILIIMFIRRTTVTCNMMINSFTPQDEGAQSTPPAYEQLYPSVQTTKDPPPKAVIADESELTPASAPAPMPRSKPKKGWLHQRAHKERFMGILILTKWLV